jgi:hypothetical protein
MPIPRLPRLRVSWTSRIVLLVLSATVAGGAPITGGHTLHICPAPSAGCDTTALAEGLRRATAGTVVILAPGTYREAGVITADGVTLRAQAGARVVGVAAEGKAALVIRGNGTVIEGLDCSGIAVPDRNGACVRLEGRDLTLRRVYFHDAEQGVLIGDQGGAVVIEDSRFERLGAIGRSHGVYANHIRQLTIRRSCFLSSRDEGHEVKSRAAHTVIEASVIASLDGVDSRLVDVPNGGGLIIRDSVLEKGPRSSNRDVIGFGLEGIGNPANGVRLENSVVILDRPDARLIDGPVPATLSGVRVVGGGQREAATAEWLPDRQAAGLPPYAASVEPLAKLFKLRPDAMPECLRPDGDRGRVKS